MGKNTRKCFLIIITAVIFAGIMLSSGHAYAASYPVSEVTSRESHTAAILEDGTLWTWGRMYVAYSYSNSSRQYMPEGRNGYKNEEDFWPSRIANGTNVRSVVLGSTFGGFIRNDGSLWMWGGNESGQLANGKKADGNNMNTSMTPSKVNGISGKVKDLVVSYELGTSSSVVAVTEDGKLYLWGDTEHEYLIPEMGRTDYTTQLTAPKLIMENVEKAALNDERIAVIKKDGSLWIWGDNGLDGACGIEKGKSAYVPIQLCPGKTFKDVQLNIWNGFALTKSGEVYAWGCNTDGMLGVGDSESRFSPVRIPGLSGITSMVTGRTSYALDNNGDLWSWGVNNVGQRGTGKREACLSPTRISIGGVYKNAARILSERNTNTALVLMKDGSVWGWGHNTGQLGDVDGPDPNAPAWIPYPVKVAENIQGGFGGDACGFLIGKNKVLMAAGGPNEGVLGIGPREFTLHTYLPVAFDHKIPVETQNSDSLSGESDSTEGSETQNKETGKVSVPAGTVFVAGGNSYKVTSAGNVTFTRSGKKSGSVVIPDTVKKDGMTLRVTAIGAKAFQKSKIKKITIGSQVESIGARAFYKCKKLKMIRVRTEKLTLGKIGSKAFKGTPAKAKVKVPSGKKKTYRKWFIKKGLSKKAKVR